jgi:penicillin amidase
MEDLPRTYDPERGFIVTANDDLNHLGKVHPINADMGPYRAERITEMIAAKSKISAEDMKPIQLDVRSKQAERFLPIIKPLLPDNPDGRALREWDLRYDPDSRGADAFERFYRELFRTVFGAQLGRDAIGFLENETGIFTDFYSAFDRILLSERSIWFGDQTREQLFERAISRALTATPRRWGERRKIVQRHLLFGEKLPLALGFDRGPIELAGGRATPRQGQIYRSAGRLTTFAPAFRFIADFAVRGWESCLAGGPSDRRFSRWYASEMEAWLEGRYKRIEPFKDT